MKRIDGIVQIIPTPFHSNRQHSNFCRAKLEEPLMADKVIAIRERIGSRAGILEGWGGMYLLELMPHRICGVMPGVPLIELPAMAYGLRKSGRNAETVQLNGTVSPFISFTLQNLEVFWHAEKRLPAMRGLLESPPVRNSTCTLSDRNAEYANLLCEQVLDVIEKAGNSY
ncbi:MAG: hypothetical protein FJ314_03980 [SAR202 cluster bacterium]|nr:hypothetical protein [SAR202 cluster bacterium]